MGMEWIITALGGFLESLWEYVNQHLLAVGMFHSGKSMGSGGPYWASLVAVVRPHTYRSFCRWFSTLRPVPRAPGGELREVQLALNTRHFDI